MSARVTSYMQRLCSAGTAIALYTCSVQSVAAGPPGSVLKDPAAREHFATAQRHFNDEHYEAAIPELKAAYAIEPNPMLLYAWGQAERLSGNCPKAVELYRRFLDTDPAPQQVRLAEANLVDCEAELPTDDETSSSPVGTGDADTDAPSDRKWYADWLGGTLIAVGAATTITGGVLVAIGRSEIDESTRATTQGDYFDRVDSGRTKNTAGVVLLGVGAALVVGSAIRYAVVGRRARRRAVTVGPALPVGGIALSISGRF